MKKYQSSKCFINLKYYETLEGPNDRKDYQNKENQSIVAIVLSRGITESKSPVFLIFTHFLRVGIVDL